MYSLSTLCISSEETSDVSQKTYFVESTFTKKKKSIKIRFMFGLLGSKVFFHRFCFGMGSDGMLIHPKKRNVWIYVLTKLGMLLGGSLPTNLSNVS